MIEECLALAMQAPTGSNRQGWRWIVVTDPDRRAAIADIYRRSSALLGSRDADTGQARAFLEMPGVEQTAPGADRAGEQQRMGASVVHLRDHLDEVPVHVVPCLVGRPSTATTPFGLSTHYGSIYPAIWSFMLALRSRGLGSALTTAHLALEHEMATLLGIPDDVTQVALVPVAYTIGTDFIPGPRLALDRVVGWDGWAGGPSA